MNLLRPALLALAALLATTGAHAQIAFRAATSASVAGPSTIVYQGQGNAASRGNCGTINPTLPAGTAAGNLLVALVSSGAQPTLTMNGWNLLFFNVGAANHSAAIYWRIATGGDPTTIDQQTSCNSLIARISRFSGVDTQQPFQTAPVAAGNWSYQNASSVTTGTQSVPYAGAMVVFTAHSSDNDTFGAEPGFTQAYNSATTTGNDTAIALYYQSPATAPTYTAGPYNVSKNRGSDPNHGVVFALRPAGSVLTINVPAGTIANDVLVASIAVVTNNTTVSAPAGWTALLDTPQPAANPSRLVTFYRVASGAEPADYTFELDGSANGGAAGGMLAFSGVETSGAGPIDAQGANVTASGLVHAANAITTSTANTMLVGAFEFTSSPTAANWNATGGQGMTKAVGPTSLAGSNNGGVALLMSYGARSATGNTGAKSATASGVTADSGAAHLIALRPLVTINHFAISHAGSGIACVDQAITITAHDAAHAAVDAGALLVNLSTTNGKGTWTAILAGGGTLTDATPGDGAATYQFAPGSDSVQLAFRYANLAATSETFGFNVSGGGFSEATGTASGTDDPPFTMAQAGFQFRNVTDGSTTIPTQISGKPSDSGFNAKTLRIQAIRTDTVTGSCTGLFASQTRSVDLGAECNSPATCAARQVSVNGTNIATSNDNAGAGASAYTGVSLTFSASSEADTVITYPDAGQISLHARYDLDPLVAGFEMNGSSNTFVVRPFGLAFPGINHSSTAAGSLIGAAGDNFAMTVQGYQWAAGEDANNDGVPDAGVNITDNGTVPNFAATATVGRSANLPGVALGTVSRGATCAGAATIALAAGSASAADWCYSEVGNVLLTADVTNYLSAGVNITGSSGLDGVAGGGYVGRFRPRSLVVVGAPTLANRSALVCAPASGFTYMGEGLALGFTLEARNTQNALTQNYTGAYAKLDLSNAVALGIGARSGATNLTSRVDTSLAPAGGFSNGSGSLTVTTGVSRASPDNPDGPYAATQFGIAPVDSDGTAMSAFDFDVDGNAVNEHKNLGVSTELRFGRLRLGNGYGPVSSGLQLPLDLQYWNGSGFALNSADSCTTLARANLALAFSGVIAACDTAVMAPSLAFASGSATLTLAAPGTGKTGTVVLTPQLGGAAGTYCPSVGAGAAATTASAANYLLGRWDDASNPDGNANTAYDDKPSGRATFGLYGSQPKNFIFFRENY